jgi:FAS-associated factor 2
MLCWAGDAVEVEGFQVAHALGATRFPLFVVLVYNTLRSPASVSCVTKIEGLVDVAGLIDMLTTALDRYEPTLIAARLDRREQTASREIRKEQDSAYERSLAADRRRAEEARLAEEIRAREIAEAEESARQQLLYRAWRHARLLPEPDAGANAQVARVSFRMPDGTRVVRKFDAACMIEELYAFVDAKLNPLSDEERNRAGEVTDQPAQAYQYTFTLAVPMPRTVITCSKESKIADRKEVSPSGSLIVEPLEDEEMIA